MSKKLIGKNIVNETIIVECEDHSAEMKARHAFGKAGIALELLDKAIKEEADRLVNRPDDKPKYRF
jgi:hypothetical protein